MSGSVRTAMAVSSSPSKLEAAGRMAVIMLRARWWPDAVDRLDEILEIAFALSEDEPVVCQAADGLREAALDLREDAEKAERRKNVTAKRIRELAVLTKDVAEAVTRTVRQRGTAGVSEADETPVP